MDKCIAVVMNGLLTTNKICSLIGILDGKLVDVAYSENPPLDATIKVSGGIYKSPPELLEFAKLNEVFIEKHIAYDVESGTLLNVTDDEVSLLTQL